MSVDLASIGPLLAQGRRAARDLIEEVSPDLLFATAAEAEALLGRYAVDELLEFAPTPAVKRGSKGATVLAREGTSRLRFEIATEHLTATDTTGAGDAFDAGFLVGWFTAQAAGRTLPASLQRAALAGHRAAARQLSTPRLACRWPRSYREVAMGSCRPARRSPRPHAPPLRDPIHPHVVDLDLEQAVHAAIDGRDVDPDLLAGPCVERRVLRSPHAIDIGRLAGDRDDRGRTPLAFSMLTTSRSADGARRRARTRSGRTAADRRPSEP